MFLIDCSGNGEPTVVRAIFQELADAGICKLEALRIVWEKFSRVFCFIRIFAGSFQDRRSLMSDPPPPHLLGVYVVLWVDAIDADVISLPLPLPKICVSHSSSCNFTF